MFVALAPTGALTLALCFLSYAGLGFGATLEEWRKRSIYQIMTDRFSVSDETMWTPCPTFIGPYCGGTWRGIMQNLDYIQGMNFDAIWISPVVAQVPQVTKDGTSYAGYWQQNLYFLNDKFGSFEDLQALIDAVHDRGMFFMMDIITNHMGFYAINGGPPGIDYSILKPFNNVDYYHPYCPMDYSGNNVTSLEQCWLGDWNTPLADLKTESDTVQSMFASWIQEMVANYSMDGLRIDAGANVEPDFFTGFMEKAGLFATAEVYLSNDSVACQWQETVGSIINYPLYWLITSSFTGGDMGDLVKMMESERQNCKDVTALSTFSEYVLCRDRLLHRVLTICRNHDVPRFANHTSDLSLAMNVATYVIMSDGIPIVYQGQEQHMSGGTNPFTNREPLWESGLDVFSPMYQQFASLNTLRKHVIQLNESYVLQQSSFIHQDSGTIAMARGSDGAQVITVLTNSGADFPDWNLDLSVGSLGYGSGTSLTEVLSCKTYTVDTSGSLTLPITQGLPMVLYSTDGLSNSSLCGASGKKFAEAKYQVVTATTTTATISGVPTVFASTATIPEMSTSATMTLTAPAGSTPTAGARQMVVDPKVALPLVAIAAGVLGYAT